MFSKTRITFLLKDCRENVFDIIRIKQNNNLFYLQLNAHASAALASVAVSVASSERAYQLTAAVGVVKLTDLLRGFVARPRARRGH